MGGSLFRREETRSLKPKATMVMQSPFEMPREHSTRGDSAGDWSYALPAQCIRDQQATSNAWCGLPPCQCAHGCRALCMTTGLNLKLIQLASRRYTHFSGDQTPSHVSCLCPDLPTPRLSYCRRADPWPEQELPIVNDPTLV